jgi:ATP:ADP antiporter, AAA family
LILALLNAVYTGLRGAAVASGLSTGIPQLQLVGLFPATIVSTIILRRALQHFSWKLTFAVVASLFSIFFLLFPLGWFPSGSFYVVGELWRVVLIATLFWGYLNGATSPLDARGSYGWTPLYAGVGSILGGLYGSLVARLPFNQTLICLGLFAAACTALAVPLFWRMGTSVATLRRGSWQPLAPVVRGLALLLFADYLAYSLLELTFFRVLAVAKPDPSDYAAHISMLVVIGESGRLAVGLLLAPLVLRRAPWIVSALVTPVTVVILGSWFILSSEAWIVGSILYCACRVAKHGFLDPAKELAMVPLDPTAQAEGKLLLEGPIARGGRAASAFIAMGVQSLPGVAAIVGVASAVWIRATFAVMRHTEEHVVGAEVWGSGSQLPRQVSENR